jgi:hypothetical protein
MPQEFGLLNCHFPHYLPEKTDAAACHRRYRPLILDLLNFIKRDYPAGVFLVSRKKDTCGGSRLRKVLEWTPGRPALGPACGEKL